MSEPRRRDDASFDVEFGAMCSDSWLADSLLRNLWSPNWYLWVTFESQKMFGFKWRRHRTREPGDSPCRRSLEDIVEGRSWREGDRVCRVVKLFSGWWRVRSSSMCFYVVFDILGHLCQTQVLEVPEPHKHCVQLLKPHRTLQSSQSFFPPWAF